MGIFTKAVGTAQKTGGFVLFIRRFVFFTLLFFLFLGVILNAIALGIKEKSVYPPLKDLGERFLKSSQKLDEESLKIIDNKGLVEEEKEGLYGTWSGLLLFSSWFSALFIYYMWLKVLAKIYSASPFSNSSNTFINWSLSFITFSLIQMLILIIWSAIAGEITNLSDAINLLMTPLLVVWHTLLSLPYMLPNFIKNLVKE